MAKYASSDGASSLASSASGQSDKSDNDETKLTISSAKTAVLKLLSALRKNESGVGVTAVFLLIEFIQLLTFAFLVPGWGPIGEAFSSVVE